MFRKKQFKHGIRFAWHLSLERMLTAVEVDNGLACHCICAACKARLIARQGDLRIWHFAHHRESDCPYATETAIHWMAKQLIAERGGIFVPHRGLSKTVHGQRNVWFEKISVDVQQAGFQHITDCRIEKSIEGTTAESSYRRPDLIAQLDGRPLAIEIHNTHAVDLEKAKWLEQQGFSILEIDVNDLETLPTDAYKAALEHRLFATNQESRWLAHMGDREAQDRLAKLEQELRLAKKTEEEEALARLDAEETARKRHEELLKRFRDVEQFKFRLSDGTLRVGRNEVRATLKIYGSASDALFPKIVELARQYGGKFNPRGRCWEFYRYNQTKPFFDLLSSKVKEIAMPSSTERLPLSAPLSKVDLNQNVLSAPPRQPLRQYFDDPNLQELFDERAAIFEYEGGVSRANAEQQALIYVNSIQNRQFEGRAGQESNLLPASDISDSPAAVPLSQPCGDGAKTNSDSPTLL